MQFLTKEQVFQLGEVADDLDVPVLTYGIRTDFQGEPFLGSKYLLSWADNLKELKAYLFLWRQSDHGDSAQSGRQCDHAGLTGRDRWQRPLRVEVP